MNPAVAALLVLLGAATGPAEPAAHGEPVLTLPVPVLEQRPERCGPAALEMVLRFHGASAGQAAFADSAYDPVLRGALITDLAAWARRAGFDARVARVDEDSLVSLLRRGLPPIVARRLLGRGR